MATVTMIVAALAGEVRMARERVKLSQSSSE